MHYFNHDEYSREFKLLKSMLPKGIYEILQRLGARVAGGTLTSLFTNREINDIDLYFPSWQNLELFIAYMQDQDLRSGDHDLTPCTGGWNTNKRVYKLFYELDNGAGTFNEHYNAMCVGQDPDHREIENLEEKVKSISPGFYQAPENAAFIESLGMTDKSVMFTDRNHPVMQVIAFDVFPEVADIFNKFDWTINMGAFDFATEQWVFSNNFLKHLSQRVLVLNPGTDYPIISMLRASKYQARGYTISRRETMKLGIAASKLRMETWQDAKDHLSGMYGTNVEELFRDDKDFSFDLLFDKLDSAGEMIITSIATESEKRASSTYQGLRSVTLFETLQRLRKHTGREYFKEFYGVAAADNFHLLAPSTKQHILHVGKELLPESESNDDSPITSTPKRRDELVFVTLYASEKAARDAFNTRGQPDWKGVKDWRPNPTPAATPGAVLLKIGISDPCNLDMDYDEVVVIDSKRRKTKVVIQDVIDINGEVS